MRRLFRTRLYPYLIALAAGAALACGGSGGGGVAFPTACSSTAPTPNPSGIAGTVCYQFVPSTVAGALEFGHATLKPARNVTVEVVQGTTTLATTTTDESGHFNMNFTPGGSGALELRALAETATPAIQVVDNTASKAVWGVGADIDGSTHAKDLVAVHGWTGSSYDDARRLAAPFAILDTMYNASQAFLAVRTVTFPELKVNWSPKNYPNGDGSAPGSGNIGTSHFSPDENGLIGEIYILGQDGADTDEFDNHVIAHEWGHFFEHNLSRSDSPGGFHGGGDVLDPRLAFGEGYGDAIAAMVLADPLYVDTMWDGTTLGVGVTFDAETAPTTTDDPYPDAFSEMSILRLLYDIFDSGSNESYDKVAVGLGTIYDVLTGPEKTTAALTTIGSFITGLKAQSGVVAADVDTLMAHYNIGAITDDWGTGDTLGSSGTGGLQAMYIFVNSLPASISPSPTFTAGIRYNLWDTNYYFVVTGTGSPVTVEGGSSAGYFRLKAYHVGTIVDEMAVAAHTGTLNFGTTNGEKYVVVLTGATTGSGEYTVPLSFHY